MSRRYIDWGHWNELAKESGIKRKVNVNKKNDEKRKSQRKKFTKCKECGGQMTYVPNSNIFVCDNEVEKKRTIKLDDGTETTKIEKRRCGNTNFVSDQYMGYIRYLFED